MSSILVPSFRALDLGQMSGLVWTVALHGPLVLTFLLHFHPVLSYWLAFFFLSEKRTLTVSPYPCVTVLYSLSGSIYYVCRRCSSCFGATTTPVGCGPSKSITIFKPGGYWRTWYKNWRSTSSWRLRGRRWSFCTCSGKSEFKKIIYWSPQASAKAIIIIQCSEMSFI